MSVRWLVLYACLLLVNLVGLLLNIVHRQTIPALLGVIPVVLMTAAVTAWICLSGDSR